MPLPLKRSPVQTALTSKSRSPYRRKKSPPHLRQPHLFRAAQRNGLRARGRARVEYLPVDAPRQRKRRLLAQSRRQGYLAAAANRRTVPTVLELPDHAANLFTRGNYLSPGAQTNFQNPLIFQAPEKCSIGIRFAPGLSRCASVVTYILAGECP